MPLDATKPLRVLLVALSSDPDPNPGETIEPEIRPRVDSLKVLRADTQYAPVSTLTLPPPDSYDVAIAALFVRVTDRKGNVGFPDDQIAFVNEMIATSKPTVIASFGNPYLIERFPNAKTWLAENFPGDHPLYTSALFYVALELLVLGITVNLLAQYIGRRFDTRRVQRI